MSDPSLDQPLSSGARYYKCALQVNPHSCVEKFRQRKSEYDEREYATALAGRALQEGVSVLAITDHCSVAGIPAIRKVASEVGIHVFPGFELTSSEGIHVLCLYPLEKQRTELERLLGGFGIHGTDPISAPCSKSFREILQMAADQGAVTIAAHATNAGGLFRVLQGQARINAWADENLTAIQIPGSVAELPQDVRRIVQNKDPNYRRTATPEDDLGIAVVNSGDVTIPEDLARPGTTCWIKMSSVGIEGLRQAFLDPRSRVRLHGDAVPDGHTEMLSLTWEGGFLDGTSICFNSNLNALIGGRGSGKSTVIESIRYVLEKKPSGEEASRVHDAIVKHVLGSGAKISLRLRIHRPIGKDYIVERTVSKPAVVRDGDTGKITNIEVSMLLAGAEIYGQHEISELTRSQEKLTRLLTRFTSMDRQESSRKRELQSVLVDSRRRIVATRGELRSCDERLEIMPSLQETLKRYQEAGLEETLKDQSILVEEEGLLTVAGSRLEPIRDQLDNLRGEMPIDLTFLSSDALSDLPEATLLAEAGQVLEVFGRDVEQWLLAGEKMLADAGARLMSLQGKLGERAEGIRRDYEKKLRYLHKSRVNGEEFIRLREQLEALRPVQERSKLLHRQLQEQEKRRHSLLIEWEELLGEEFRSYERAARKVSRALQGRVRVHVQAHGDREPLYKALREGLGGRLSESVEALGRCDLLSPSSIVRMFREGKDVLRDRLEIPESQARRLAQADAEVLMRMEELDLPTITRIELNVAGQGGSSEQWQPLDQLSTGQKATAVLLLLLLESDGPLVIDQPEDDLDNRFVTEEVIPRMREAKHRRQFIFSTHNANIPVLGDAELILGLTSSAEGGSGRTRIAPEHAGSIDARPVMELVERLLEGGQDAFERRRRKYGF